MIADQLTLLGADQLLVPLIQQPNFLPEEQSESEPQYIGDSASTQLLQLCLQHRLAPILSDAVHNGRIVLEGEATAELPRAVEHFLSSQLKVERQGMIVIDALLDADIDFRVLKGMASAFLDYPNPAMRGVRRPRCLGPSRRHAAGNLSFERRG